ncbi:MAG: hypothetical protein ABR540_02940 [Acidimicrobiales bacterium]
MDTEALINRLVTGPCEAARELFDFKKTEIRRYTALAFALAVAVVLVAVVAIVALLVSKEWGLGVISALGTVVGGAAWIAIFKIRADAMKEADDFLEKIKEHCGAAVAQQYSRS